MILIQALIRVPPAPILRVLHVSTKPLLGISPGDQFRSIGMAAGIVRAGDHVLIHTGIYRESVTVTTSGTASNPIVFESAPMAHVVVTGADRIGGWRPETGKVPGGHLYSAPWPYRFISWNPSMTHPADDFHSLVGRAEQVFVSGYPLRQVLRCDEMSRGAFFADTDAKRLYVWAADNRVLKAGPASESPVEASTRDVMWESKGSYVTLKGIRFRYAANHAQQGAVQLAGQGDSVEDCRFEQTNASGAAFLAPDQTAIRCEFCDNGQIGWSADRAHRLRMAGCLTARNNMKGFDRDWEAGGDKLVLSRGVVIDHSRFIGNRGCGIWFDIGNEDSEVRNCLIADNEDAGIFYKISYGLHAHDNVILDNGFADTPGAWGAAAGICLSSSPSCLVERNLLIDNKEGFDFREQERTTPRIDAPYGAKEEPVWVHDEIIRHNVLAFNRDAQTWGWFDVTDRRMWPAKAAGSRQQTAGKIATGLASVAELRISLAANVYFAEPGQGLFNWGAAWREHRHFENLNSVRRELGFEHGSFVAPVGFADPSARDFRVAAESSVLRLGCYPRGSVPGVTLGIAGR